MVGKAALGRAGNLTLDYEKRTVGISVLPVPDPPYRSGLKPEAY